MAMWQATFEPGGQTKLLTAPKILTDHRYSGLYICTGNSFFNIGKFFFHNLCTTYYLVPGPNYLGTSFIYVLIEICNQKTKTIGHYHIPRYIEGIFVCLNLEKFCWNIFLSEKPLTSEEC